jgi:hypothetical protein
MYRVELPSVEEPVIATGEPCAVLRESLIEVTGQDPRGTGETVILAPVS